MQLQLSIFIGAALSVPMSSVSLVVKKFVKEGFQAVLK